MSRGQPVWRALAVLVLVPLLAAAVMGGISVTAAGRSADQALRAQRLVAIAERLDAARRAADAEVLPTMLLGILLDRERAEQVGFDASRRAVLEATEPGRLAQARAVTDSAMAAVVAAPGVSGVDPRPMGVREALRAVRALADQGTGRLGDVSQDYAAIASTLGSAQRRASAEAISSGLSTRSVSALQDLDLVLQLSESASRQLAELFASRVLTQPDASAAQRAWIAAWGTYTQLVSQPERLTTASTRVAWTVFAATADVTSFSALLDRQALDPRRDVLETGAVPGLGAASGRRDNAVAVVLEYAVTSVTDAARADRAAATARERLMLEICLAMVILSLLNAGLVARWLTSSMRSLAAGAQQVSLGNLLDVEPRGPRELRTAAEALSSAVAGLRRVQEQARAVVAGDLAAALDQPQLPGPLGEVVHASVEQIVEAFQTREKLQDELTHQASHDALTGLANRAQTLRILSAAIASKGSDGLPTGVLFIDLDGFKAVNDGHGHAVGDALLCEISRRLVTAVRPGDTVGRLGGDEFVVVVEQVREAVDLVEVGRRLVQVASLPVLLEGADGTKQVKVGASIGVAVSSHVDTADDLLAEADQAAYRAKRLGRGRVEVFDDDLRAELVERADLDVALRGALEAGGLRLDYQPVVSLTTGELVGYEALARWTHDQLGPVSPDIFIAVAEASTLICDLGAWALLTATSQLARWRALGVAGFGPDGGEPTVAVNISGRHLADPRVLADVAHALEVSGLPTHLLVLEITETVLTDHAGSTRRHLQELRALGLTVAIDDFGTGYTSIGALPTTPADILKIDRSFVGSEDPGHHHLATLITRAAHTFSLRVVAEGIETPAQLARVQADGCDEGQGYLFSRPLSADAVEGLLSTRFFPTATIPTNSTIPTIPTRS